MPERPTGTVTFLFTDIEGSTTRWEHHPEVMREALARHDALLRSVIIAHGGFVFKMVGDAVYAAFAVAADAVAAAVAAQRAVAGETWGEVGPLRVRMALHTGAAQSRDDDYFGPTLNRVARVLSTGYGGQVLLSAATLELVRDALSAGVSVQDLGEHALKDLLRPEHIFQLTIPNLTGEFPALKSLSRRPHNLPVQPTPFLGREREVAGVCALLSRPEVRLLTLTGPGGIGKTRLSLQVAAEVSDQFADGVFFVALAPLSDAELVMPTIMQTLSISEVGGQPLLVLLKAALKDKHLLLLLDNFEQVMRAAVQVAELLAACPKLKIIVTSRMVLHVQAEREFVVPSLSLPDPKRLPDLGTLSQCEAVALFIERSQAVKPDFAVTNANAPAVAAICVRLDGLPLAIELAAARSKLLPPQALLARLSQRLAVLTSGARDVPARHQTLRNTIAWSYDLLGAAEQQLFRRLSVFVGSCTLEAIEALCNALDSGAEEVLDSVTSLLDKSLLQQTEQEGEEPRLSMLETIREFGLEVLAMCGEMEVTRQAHAQYYLALAEEAEPELAGPQQGVWLERLEREHDNLRAALQWSVKQGGVGQHMEMVLRLSGALWWFWLVRGHLSEGGQWLEKALMESEGSMTLARARALQGLGEVAFNQGNYGQAEKRCRESLAIFRELGDRKNIALSLDILGLVAEWSRNYTAAYSLIEEALALYKELGDKRGLAYTLGALAYATSHQGEYARARSLAEESLALFREVGDKAGITYALSRLVEVMLFQGDLARAHSLLRGSLVLSRELGDKGGIAESLDLSGQIACYQDAYATASSLFEESLAVQRELGDKAGIAHSLSHLGRVAAIQGDYTAAHPLYKESLGIAREAGDKELVASGLEGLAGVVAAQGEPAWAARLWGAAEAVREVIGVPIPPVERANYERAVAAARAQLGKKAFAAAWAEGRATPLEQGIANALKMGD
jgi:predicted ATPase/class 3 adenylate cyclase